MAKRDTLFGKLIDIYAEQARAKKAVRVLAKQEWSVEFLEYLVLKCAKQTRKDVQMVVKNGSKVLTISSVSAPENPHVEDEDILMHLDDTAAVNDFIRRHGK